MIVSDSTTVELLPAREAPRSTRGPGGGSIVTDRAELPDRPLRPRRARRAIGTVEIAWLDPDPIDGPNADDVAAALDAHPGDVALVTLSHVNYRSAAIADLPAITALAHDAGALVLWDLSHSAGSIPVELEGAASTSRSAARTSTSTAGPGAPAYLYVRSDAPGRAPQPDPGLVRAGATSSRWARAIEPRPGIAGWLTGTPGILGLAAAEDGIRSDGGGRHRPGSGPRGSP